MGHDEQIDSKKAYAAGVVAYQTWWNSNDYNYPKPPYDCEYMNFVWSEGFHTDTDVDFEFMKYA